MSFGDLCRPMPPTMGSMNSAAVICPWRLTIVTLAVVIPQSPNMFGTLAKLVLARCEAVAARSDRRLIGRQRKGHSRLL